MAYTRVKLDKRIMGVLVLLKKTKGAGERGKATKAEQVLEASLQGMIYAGNARVVSQSPEQLRKRMRVIMVV